MEIDIRVLQESLLKEGELLGCEPEDLTHVRINYARLRRLNEAAQYLLDNADLMLVKLPDGYYYTVIGIENKAPATIGANIVNRIEGHGYAIDDCASVTGDTPHQASMAALAKIGEEK